MKEIIKTEDKTRREFSIGDKKYSCRYTPDGSSDSYTSVAWLNLAIGVKS